MAFTDKFRNTVAGLMTAAAMAPVATQAQAPDTTARTQLSGGQDVNQAMTELWKKVADGIVTGMTRGGLTVDKLPDGFKMLLRHDRNAVLAMAQQAAPGVDVNKLDVENLPRLADTFKHGYKGVFIQVDKAGNITADKRVNNELSSAGRDSPPVGMAAANNLPATPQRAARTAPQSAPPAPGSEPAVTAEDLKPFADSLAQITCALRDANKLPEEYKALLQHDPGTVRRMYGINDPNADVSNLPRVADQLDGSNGLRVTRGADGRLDASCRQTNGNYVPAGSIGGTGRGR